MMILLWTCLLTVGRTPRSLKCAIFEFLDVYLASHCVLYMLNTMYSSILMWVSNTALFSIGK